MKLRPEKTTAKVAATLALAVAVLSGCGGGSAYVAPTPPDPTPVITTISAAGIVKYFSDMFASTSETTEPLNANLIELAVDDSAEPATL